MLVLGIESSCDETSVSVVRDGKEVLSNVIYTQIDIHKEFGGVVPEIASRHHVEKITYVFETALKEANVVPDDIEYTDVFPVQYPPVNDPDNVGELKWRTSHYDYHSFESNLLKLDILRPLQFRKISP